MKSEAVTRRYLLKKGTLIKFRKFTEKQLRLRVFFFTKRNPQQVWIVPNFSEQPFHQNTFQRLLLWSSKFSASCICRNIYIDKNYGLEKVCRLTNFEKKFLGNYSEPYGRMFLNFLCLALCSQTHIRIRSKQPD